MPDVVSVAKRVAACFCLICFLPILASAQVGPWTSHTSMRAVNSVALTESKVFAGTSGGVFAVDKETSDVTTFTIVDGLHSVVVGTLVAGTTGEDVWIGYSDGVLDRLDPDDGSVSTFRDIQRASQFSARGINKIRVRGDSLLISSGFGIVVFDARMEEVRDSYTRLGTFNPGIDVRDVAIIQGASGLELWAATAEGVASAPFSGSNLQDPAVWTSVAFASGANAIASHDGVIYVASDNGLYSRQSDGSFLQVATGEIRSLTSTSESLLATGEFRLFVLDGGGLRALNSPEFSAPSELLADADGTIWLGDTGAGLVEAAAVTTQTTTVDVLGSVYPEGPVDGLYTQIAVSSNGTVAAAGVPGTGKGFYVRASDGSWASYTASLTPELLDRGSFLSVAIDNSETVWAGSFGDGVTSVSSDGTISNFDVDNSSLLPASPTVDYIIVGGVRPDASDNIWVTTQGSAKPLHVREATGTWTALDPYIGQGLTSQSTAYGKITIDSFGQKWIIVRSESAFSVTRGLMVLDTRNTPLDQTDDAFRFFGSSGGSGQGLPSTVVTAVAEDRDGLMWIGTDEGLAYFVNTGIVADDQNSVPVWPQRADRSQGVFLLFGLKVNALAVDPANRLWVGSDDGLRVVQSAEGGFEEVMYLSTANSPLPSNRVIDIGVHAASGEMYIVTDAGMVSTRGDAIEPSTSVSDLFIYPNPLNLATAGTEEIFIEGLVEGTTVSIIGPAGQLVRRIETRGGRVRWDSRDETGRPVQSGVYVVVAVGHDGEGAGYGKVAIIR